MGNSFLECLSTGLPAPLEGKVFLAAVSGGADSTALLCGLSELHNQTGFTLHCAHVEHGLRPAEESRGDAGAVEMLCEKLKVPCRVITVPRGKIASYAASGGTGIEEAARIFRYRILYRERRRVGADWIITAHTRDDVLENLLIRILRGSGPAGLALMPRQRRRLLRPLLDITRQEILQYLGEINIPFRLDSTNEDIRFFRNRVRNKLIPLLDDFFPSWRVSLPALAKTQSLAADFLAREAAERLRWEGGAESPMKGRVLRLNEKDFYAAHPILREEAIFAAVDMLAASDTGRNRKKLSHIALPRRAAIRRSVMQECGSADLGPVRLEKKNGFLELRPVRKLKGEKGFSLLVQRSGFYTLDSGLFMSLPSECLCVRTACFKDDEVLQHRAGEDESGGCTQCFKVFSFPFVFRNYHEGDLLHRGGHARRFSDIMDGGARSGCAGILTVCDALGVAAFIAVGSGGEIMVIGRDGTRDGAADGAGTVTVQVFGNPGFGGQDA